MHRAHASVQTFIRSIPNTFVNCTGPLQEAQSEHNSKVNK